MSVNDNLPRASFDAIEFPFLSRQATLDTRTHVHEYAKMAGGSVEKLGRKLWSFTFRVPFHTSPYFPDLYPGSFKALAAKCAALDTAVLVVPELGEIRSILTKFEADRKGAIKSGEDAVLTFLEDDLEPLRPRSTLSARADMSTRVQDLYAYIYEPPSTLVGLLKEADASEYLLNILSAIQSYLAIGDQIDLYGQRAQSLLLQIKGLVRQTHDLLRPAALDPIRQNLRAIWDAANAISQDVTGQRQKAVLVPYVVPRLMAVGTIAQSLYGNGARGGELLALNPDITDPFAVPAGTRLVVHTE